MKKTARQTPATKARAGSGWPETLFSVFADSLPVIPEFRINFFKSLT
jgi:hypothetical protein